MIEARPLRSVLYVPGSKPGALEKARGLPADAIIFDLEDAVVPAEKAAARAQVVAALTAGGFGPRLCLVRVNAPGTPWGEADLAAVAPVAEAVLLPKVELPVTLTAVREAIDRPVWAMIETPRGVVGARELAAAWCAGFVIGTNDLAKELGVRDRADRLPLLPALGTCLLAARAAGIPCIDGVFNAFRDAAGFRAECEAGRDLGMDGKTLIHPDQIAVANEVFAPSENEIVLARRRIEAFEAAEAAGQGVAVLDGRIVENLHVAAARATLGKAEAIRVREAA